MAIKKILSNYSYCDNHEVLQIRSGLANRFGQDDTMEESMVKLVAVDLDGTFLNSQREVSKRNIETIKQIQKMGIKFITNTGRDYGGVKTVLSKSQIECDYICMNGGAVFNSEGELVRVNDMNREDVTSLLNSVNQDEYYIDINTDQGNCVTIPKEQAEEYIIGWMGCYNNGDITKIDKREMERDLARLKESFLYIKDIDEIYEKGHKVCKISISHRDTDRILKLRQELSLNQNISVAASFDTNIEITDKFADKGLALEAYAKENNIKMSEVMAFGDSLNDYSMLSRDFGYTVAMGNATEEIKKTAKFITKTNDEDGVASFIHEIIFNS
ncbi:MAG: Cof-type HAD-IIB family hydrolase [Lachnotalea sp.]